MNNILDDILTAPVTSPLIPTLSVAYAIAWSISIYDTRLIQAKSRGFYSGVTAKAGARLLPNWVGFIDWAKWTLFIAILILDWKYALALYAFLFVLRVLPVLERVGGLIMHPFLCEERREMDLEGDINQLEGELARTKSQLVQKKTGIKESIHSLKPESKPGDFVPPFHVWAQFPEIQELNIEEALDQYIDNYELLRQERPNEGACITRLATRLKVLDESRDAFATDVQEELDKYIHVLSANLMMKRRQRESDQRLEAYERRIEETGCTATSGWRCTASLDALNEVTCNAVNSVKAEKCYNCGAPRPKS